jgi:hypothetical protein
VGQNINEVVHESRRIDLECLANSRVQGSVANAAKGFLARSQEPGDRRQEAGDSPDKESGQERRSTWQAARNGKSQAARPTTNGRDARSTGPGGQVCATRGGQDGRPTSTRPTATGRDTFGRLSAGACATSTGPITTGSPESLRGKVACATGGGQDGRPTSTKPTATGSHRRRPGWPPYKHQATTATGAARR